MGWPARLQGQVLQLGNVGALFKTGFGEALDLLLPRGLVLPRTWCLELLTHYLAEYALLSLFGNLVLLGAHGWNQGLVGRRRW